MKPTQIIIVFALTLFVAVVQTGCSTSSRPITGAEKDAVLAYAEPEAENLFQGYNQKDYPAFSKNFDAAMLKGINPTSFGNLENTLMPKIGRYVSRNVASVNSVGKFIQVLYTAKFEQEDAVTVRLVFNQDDAHTVTGLWFDSPKLRQK